MNKREEAKEKTRTLILEKSRNLFIRRGVINTSTIQIAEACGIAHGTVFLYYKNRERLVSEVFQQEFHRLMDEIFLITEKSTDLEPVFDFCLSFLEKEEDFISMISREFPFYPEHLQQQIVSLEESLRSDFQKALEFEKSTGRIGEINIESVLEFLFGALNYYMVRKKFFVKEGSVIKNKKESIKRTFFNMISNNPQI